VVSRLVTPVTGSTLHWREVPPPSYPLFGEHWIRGLREKTRYLRWPAKVIVLFLFLFFLFLCLKKSCEMKSIMMCFRKIFRRTLSKSITIYCRMQTTQKKENKRSKMTLNYLDDGESGGAYGCNP
jgi:hypothetical protein